jgi:hypothetical protein
MMRIAWALVSAEAIKLRRTLALWLVVLAPVLAITLELIGLFTRDSIPIGDSRIVWRNLLREGWSWWLLLIVPMLISFEAASLANLEYGGKHWKQIFACPVPRWSVYATKLLFCGLLVGASFLVVILGFVADVLICGAVRGSHLAAGIPWAEIVTTAGKGYLAVWLLIVIQSWLSWRFAGIAAPVGIGFAAFVTGFLLLPLHRGDFSSWHPWMLAFRTLQVGPYDLHNQVLPLVFGCAGGLVLSVLACWDLARRREGD